MHACARVRSWRTYLPRPACARAHVQAYMYMCLQLQTGLLYVCTLYVARGACIHMYVGRPER